MYDDICENLHSKSKDSMNIELKFAVFFITIYLLIYIVH